MPKRRKRRRKNTHINSLSRLKIQKRPSVRKNRRAFFLALLDPWEGPSGPYNFRRDTSHLVLLALQRRGHRIFYADPSDLGARNGQIIVEARPVRPLEKSPYFKRRHPIVLPIHFFDAVLIRKDPPVDASYLHALQLLSLARDETCILNNPDALRDFNEKLIILHFPKWIPPTIVASSARTIDGFAKAVGGTIILKPLDGFGSRGVRKLRQGTQPYRNFLEKLGTTSVMAQKYLPEVRLGEKRIFMVAGKPLGALLKIPSSGSFVTNPDLGASMRPAELTREDRALCRGLAPFFRKHGIFWAGIDTIGGRLTEINITSPGLVWEWNQTDGLAHEEEIADAIEMRLQHRK